MLSPGSLSKVSDWLLENHFFRKDHQLIFRAVSELWRRGSPCDAVTLGDWFEANDLARIIGRSSYLIELANTTPSAANIVAYAEIVVEKSRLRAAIAVGNGLVAAASAPGAESQQIIGTAAHELAQMQASNLRGGLEPVRGTM
jgi:replicative DNA helicase